MRSSSFMAHNTSTQKASAISFWFVFFLAFVCAHHIHLHTHTGRPSRAFVSLALSYSSYGCRGSYKQEIPVQMRSCGGDDRDGKVYKESTVVSFSPERHRHSCEYVRYCRCMLVAHVVCHSHAIAIIPNGFSVRAILFAHAAAHTHTPSRPRGIWRHSSSYTRAHANRNW